VIWWLSGDARLGSAARAAIERAGLGATVSSASVWEAAIQRASGRLRGPELAGAATAAGFSLLPIDQHHARLAGELPLLHRDPFDRMLVAQAMIEQLPIVSRDAIIARYGVPVLW